MGGQNAALTLRGKIERRQRNEGPSVPGTSNHVARHPLGTSSNSLKTERIAKTASAATRHPDLPHTPTPGPWDPGAGSSRALQRAKISQNCLSAATTKRVSHLCHLPVWTGAPGPRGHYDRPGRYIRRRPASAKQNGTVASVAPGTNDPRAERPWTDARSAGRVQSNEAPAAPAICSVFPRQMAAVSGDLISSL